MQYNGNTLRHELKYYINYHDYRYLSARLAAMLKIDENAAGAGYRVSSLYFDDVYHSALFEKESGIEYRKKYRIRIYNGQDNLITLERKEKFGELISKKSLRISMEQYKNLIGGGDVGFLLESDSKMAREMYCDIKARFLRPAVIVNYEREPFVLDAGNVRITFDKNIQAGINTPDLFSDGIINVGVLEPGIMILEIKYDDYLPSHMRKLLQISSHNLCAASKYVMCRLKQFEINPASQCRLSPAAYGGFGRAV